VAEAMKRAQFKVSPAKDGWLRMTIAPVNERHAGTFGLTDVIMLSALVFAVIAAARLFIAH
jgi:hypothetical protein